MEIFCGALFRPHGFPQKDIVPSSSEGLLPASWGISPARSFPFRGSPCNTKPFLVRDLRWTSVWRPVWRAAMPNTLRPKEPRTNRPQEHQTITAARPAKTGAKILPHALGLQGAGEVAHHLADKMKQPPSCGKQPGIHDIKYVSQIGRPQN